MKIDRSILWHTLATSALLLAAVLWLQGCANVSPDGASFDKERNEQRDKQVRHNMRTAQIAVEHYAADHGGVNYPSTIDDVVKTYFPGGIDGRRAAPVGLINPYSGKNEFPELNGTIKDIDKARHGKRIPVPKGKIYYSVLDGGHSYAIIGGGYDDRSIVDENNPEDVLVFSNI